MITLALVAGLLFVAAVLWGAMHLAAKLAYGVAVDRAWAIRRRLNHKRRMRQWRDEHADRLLTVAACQERARRFSAN